jgi:hypothetical protein
MWSRRLTDLALPNDNVVVNVDETAVERRSPTQ